MKGKSNQATNIHQYVPTFWAPYHLRTGLTGDPSHRAQGHHGIFTFHAVLGSNSFGALFNSLLQCGQ